MWPKRFFLNFHGLGAPRRALEAGERAYWLPASVFRDTLDLVPDMRARGIELRFTFDDGNLSDFDQALPPLCERGLTACFFLVAGRIGRPGSLSAAQIRELAVAGMTIGSHGWDHVDWRQASPEALRRELYGSRQRLQDLLGAPVDSAAVPFGLISAHVVAAAREAGYRRIYTSSGGFATGRRGLIPRTSLQSDFEPRRDLERLASWRVRAVSLVQDPLRRLRYAPPRGLLSWAPPSSARRHRAICRD